MEDQDAHVVGRLPHVSDRQTYRLRTRSDREVIREVEPGKTYVDQESGEPFEVVGKTIPLAPVAQRRFPSRSRTCACAGARWSSSCPRI